MAIKLMARYYYLIDCRLEIVYVVGARKKIKGSGVEVEFARASSDKKVKGGRPQTDVERRVSSELF